MADRPFGFGMPDKPEDQGRRVWRPGRRRARRSRRRCPRRRGHGAVRGDGRPAAVRRRAAPVRRHAVLRGGPVNWDLAKNVARHAIVAAGDPSVLDAQRREITEAVRLADLWLDEAAEFPSGIRKIEAWSRSEWLEATFPVWAKLCDPIAAKGVEAMSGMFTADPAQLGEDVPEEMRQALGALGGAGGLGGLGAMMRQLGGAMIGSQTGTAVGELAREVIGSADIGLPLGPEGTAALLPAGVAEFGRGPVRRRRRGPALPRPARGRAPAAVRARAVAARAPARRGRAVRQRHLRRHGAAAGGHARRRHHQPRGAAARRCPARDCSGRRTRPPRRPR